MNILDSFKKIKIWLRLASSALSRDKRSGPRRVGNIYLALRRRYLLWFRKGYVKKSIAVRRGGCKMCPCCHTRGLLNKEGRCKHLSIKDNKCIVYEKLAPVCKLYPVDEKDKTPFSKERCGYYWDPPAGGARWEKLRRIYKIFFDF